ncbi:MAG: glycoside hydrolase family 3 protein, partial [Jatrophihabitans sp.]|uniref:glycoside hydrolase family 3 protein n=1 Tax=Jatrophihabitans sp. TaxID=1932789 RepID=UPI003F806D3A
MPHAAPPQHRRRARRAVRLGAIGITGALAVSITTAPTADAGPTHHPTAKGHPAAARPAYLDAKLPIAARVRDLLGRMTLAEKVGQMTQAERGAVDTSRDKITTDNLGSLLSGGGSTPATNDPQAWADMIDAYQSYALKTRLHIPLIYGIDSVHGHGNLYGATLIPHNVGLGSTRDPKLVEQSEHMVATETRATGIPWVFAPCLCVARDDRWGRTYESFGEDPALVEAMETSIDGFQGTRPSDLSKPDHVLATAKHFAGDGDTTYGSGRDAAGAHSSNYPIDQGITQVSRAHFDRIDLAPYVPAVKQHHVGSIMPSYSSVDFTNDGLGNPVKMHADAALLQGWLKDKLGFDGFVISDYNGLEQIPLPTFAAKVDAFVNAGGDMAMEPNKFENFETTLVDEVQAGHVSMARIDDAVTRILTEKFALGLFEHPYADRTHINEIGDTQHRAIARQAAAESQVLLKNDHNVLPLGKNERIYVAGRNADNLGDQAGGWTITWQGQSGTHTLGTTILQGMRQVAPRATITYSQDASAPTAGYDVGVVIVGETPYSEGYGDVGGPRWAYDPSDHNTPREPKTMELKQSDQDAIDKVCSALPKCVVLVVSGRPQIVTSQLPEIDGLVASWLPGTEGEGVADVLFGNRGFSGQLSQSWPRSADQEPINVGDRNYAPLYPFGWGLTTTARGRHAATARTTEP